WRLTCPTPGPLSCPAPATPCIWSVPRSSCGWSRHFCGSRLFRTEAETRCGTPAGGDTGIQARAQTRACEASPDGATTVPGGAKAAPGGATTVPGGAKAAPG